MWAVTINGCMRSTRSTVSPCGGSSRVVAVHAAVTAAAFALFFTSSSDSAIAAGNDTLAQGIGIRVLMARFAVEHQGANGLFGVGAFGFALLYGANRPLADHRRN